MLGSQPSVTHHVLKSKLAEKVKKASTVHTGQVLEVGSISPLFLYPRIDYFFSSHRSGGTFSLCLCKGLMVLFTS